MWWDYPVRHDHRMTRSDGRTKCQSIWGNITSIIDKRESTHQRQEHGHYTRKTDRLPSRRNLTLYDIRNTLKFYFASRCTGVSGAHLLFPLNKLRWASRAVP